MDGVLRSDDPDVRRAVADMRGAVDAVALQVDALARDVDELEDHGRRWFPLLVGTKARTVDTAQHVVDEAMRVVGGSAFRADAELARLARDVRAGQYHPSSRDSAARTIANDVLGTGVGGPWHHHLVSKQDGSNRLVSDQPVADVTATVLHVDMDAFFASVELLDRPDLVGLPVIVGHDSDRSVVTAATYEARRYGVNSAMPMAVAKRRCPNAVIVEPHFEKYQAKSRAVMQVFDRFTPRVERLGIDEAFLDVAGAVRLYGTPWQIGQAIRRAVFEETGLHCSVGAASTKFVAKLASSRAKPDGLLVVPAADTVAFLHPQPVSALWGVGGKTQEVLERRGIRTVGDLATTPLESLVHAIGPAGGQRLHDLSWGRDPRVGGHRGRREVDRARGHLRHRPDRARRRRAELLRLAEKVAVRMRRAEVQGRTLALKVRYTDFTTLTRSRTLAEPTDVARRIHREAVELYDVLHRPGNRIRLIGVRGENLVPTAASNALWDDDAPWRETETTVDAVTARFGAGVLRPASLVRGTPEQRPPTPGRTSGDGRIA